MKRLGPSKCGYGEEWRNSVGQNIITNEEAVADIGEESAMKHPLRKRQKKCIGQ